ncbi:TetR family transcriptional regulator [Microbacterium sp. EYE_5]|uniref:TetR/AcrR family transcriptional regulator n=1 Tax=unclassified Microbacterium TaxID=2609290 RepID=UPI0020067412|nr:MULTISPECIES: TetR family transcriptional regulator [unclassified Microbacterium]MCK6080915.1 TetR family transcriptional regulator [Microbacterium sp. EYE_382]MCK6086186.1 TetR family transcriptional regulator [Microbacterium sp. EYE_384]MCK6124316.1 TetR family transcriptional regulator [Microbacterium sp. EYE_80]MCK6127225.1 TetR family transcriptional regulator [Microbacterium sp. EYE_79]MCK6141870.1 TetR family transcriptional regulator [Microbacterium sp. EYE_39]
MSRPPRARESVLDAFEAALIDGGARSATMDAVAAAAGVSKGGLLYHYASKDALESALLERMRQLVDADVADMVAAPGGVVAAFVRTSVQTDTPLDRAIVAASRLAQAGHAEASAALRDVRDVWERSLRPHTRDETALQLVLLVSDGLYFNSALTAGALPGPIPRGAELDALVDLVERAVR